jgi:predicted Rossmann-fold nucleotide-binding protein
MMRKLPIVAVFGAGTAIDADRMRFAHALGVMVAGLGAHLLTGAGYGVMAAAAEGFVSATGRIGFSIGIVPRAPDGPFDEPHSDPDGRPYPNPFVEIAIRTPLPPRVGDWRTTPGRNHINVLTADAVIALPGGIGTQNELDMACEYRGERDRPRNERRTVLIGPAEAFTPAHRQMYAHGATLGDAERHVRRVLASHVLTHDARSAS